MEDEKIIELFFMRHESAITETKLKYGKRLFHTANNILHNIEDAEEVVSDALFKLWEVVPPHRPVTLGAFIAKIVRNMAINKWEARSAAKRGSGEMPIMLSELEQEIPSKYTPEKEHEGHLVTEAINKCLELMDKKARIAFVLRYFHGESIKNICTRFDMGESRVKSILFRARKKLKKYLEKEGIQV